MQRSRPFRSAAAGPFDDHINSGPQINEHADEMRVQLDYFCQRLKRGELIPCIPSPAMAPAGTAASGPGHFHLACELFLQVSGWTRFHFPHGQLLLEEGGVMVLPPKLLHAESVGPGADGTAFRSIVAYAEDTVLTCHFSYEATPGNNSIEYLESRTQTQGIQHWLNDAVRLHHHALKRKLSEPMRALVDSQIGGLVTSAVAGLLYALNDDQQLQEEPPQIRLVRAHIQNQLGDHALSIARLAAESGCSADHLSRLFQQSAGEQLVAYINRLRMERAAHLLRESDLSAKEIAWHCGFVSHSYFIRRFREHFSVTPKAWRGT